MAQIDNKGVEREREHACPIGKQSNRSILRRPEYTITLIANANQVGKPAALINTPNAIAAGT